MARIMLDIDDVIYPFVGILRQYLIRIGYDEKSLLVPTTWDLHEHWGMSPHVLWAEVGDAVDRGSIFATGQPVPGVVAAIKGMKSSGHSIHLVTARTGGRKRMAEKWTASWLADHAIPYDSLTFSADKTVVSADFALDDRVENFDMLSKGCRAYLLDQPWNQHIETGYRVHSVQEFAAQVEHWANHERVAFGVQ